MLRLSSKLKIMRPKMSQIFQNYGVASMQYKTPSGDPLFSGTTLVVATFNNYNDTQNKAAKVGRAALMIVVALVNIPLSILEGVARLLLSLVSPNFTLKQGSETFKNVLKSGLAVAEGVKLIGQAFSAPQIHPALHQVPSNGYQYPQRPEAPDNNADGQNPSNGGPDNQTPLNNEVTINFHPRPAAVVARSAEKQHQQVVFQAGSSPNSTAQLASVSSARAHAEGPAMKLPEVTTGVVVPTEVVVKKKRDRSRRKGPNLSFEDELKKIGLASRTRTERKFNLTAKKSPSSVVPNSTTEQAQALAAPVVSVSSASAHAEGPAMKLPEVTGVVPTEVDNKKPHRSRRKGPNLSFEDELKKIGLASRTRTERKFNLTAKKSPSSVVPNSTTEQAQALAAPVVSVSSASAHAEGPAMKLPEVTGVVPTEVDNKKPHRSRRKGPNLSFEDELKKIGLASRTRTERKFNLTAKKSPSSVVPNSTTEQAQ